MVDMTSPPYGPTRYAGSQRCPPPVTDPLRPGVGFAHPVADTRERIDGVLARESRGLELVAETGDVDAEHGRIVAVPRPPGRAQQHLVGEDAPARPNELSEQPELRRRQLQRRTPPPAYVADEVDRDAAEGDDLPIVPGRTLGLVQQRPEMA